MQRAAGSVGGDPLEVMVNPEDVEAQYTDADVDEMAQEAGIQPKAEDRAEPAAPESPDMAEQLQRLGVIADCDDQMPRGEIGGKVRAAVEEAGLLADHDEIERETDRIWASFGYAKSDGGPRVYDVQVDGTVKDWRRPDPGPQRDPFEPPVHQVGDDQRFSGGGAGEGHQQSLFLVPSDAQFHGKLYRDAPELGDIAERLIDQHEHLADLLNCDIRYFWRRKTGVSKGRVKIGYCKRASDLLGHFTGCDFIIWLSATTARDGKFTDRQVEAAIFHQLCHIETDDEGNFISARHDFEGFAAEIRQYGPWTEDLKVGGSAFVKANQMGLFDVDDEGIEDDEDEADDGSGGLMHAPIRDGAGTLIHADGTPMTAEEIEAQEAAEVEGETRVDCSLCDHEIPPGDVEDTFCSGCGAQVCARHRGDPPFGEHAQEEHLSDEDDDDDEEQEYRRRHAVCAEAAANASGSSTSDEGQEEDILADPAVI